MAGFVLEDLPHVAVDSVLSKLDRESLIAASNVCLTWKSIIHDLTYRLFVKSTPSNCDSDLKDKLEKCGWIMRDHDQEKCNCIELNTGLFKFIGNGSLSSKDIYEGWCGLDFSISNTKLCIIENREFSESVSVIDMIQDQSDMVELRRLEQGVGLEREVVSFALGNTLAVMEFYQNDDYGLDYERSIMRILHLWNLNTMEHVLEFSITEQAIHDSWDDYLDVHFEFEIDVNGISMAEDKLAVHLTIEPQNRNMYHTQLWEIDTSNPFDENISYCTTIKHERTRHEELMGKNYMNSKFLCIVSTDYEPDDTEYKLNIYNFESLSYDTKVIGVEDRTLPQPSERQRNPFDIVLEPGTSSKIAVLDKRCNTLNIHKLDGDEKIQVELTNIPVDVSVRLEVANFIMGNIVCLFVKENEFQFIIVTDHGEVIDGKKQKMSHYVDKYSGYRVGIDGMLVISDTSDDSNRTKFYLYNN